MHSFDIFDTLITRKTATPSGIFLLMQERLQKKGKHHFPDYLKDNFADLRIKAERNARRFKDASEICLQDIYEVLIQMAGISCKEAGALMDMERGAEAECAVGIEENIQKVIKLWEETGHVVLISDMYLSQGDIRNILSRIHPVFEKIPIYVSGEHGCTKQEGLLYLKVREWEKAEYREWTHYGDNYMSDVCMPRLLGIKAVHIAPRGMKPWERKLGEEFGLERDFSLQVVLGAVKNTCLRNSLQGSQITGASLGGILLYPYVEWILMQCLQAGIERLYFIARDGYILKKIADIYIEEKQLQIQTKYLYGSRAAWRTEDAKEKEAVFYYLQQEVDFSNDRFGFVDLRGTGYSVKCLSEILSPVIKGKLNVFYYDMVEQTREGRCRFLLYTACDTSVILEAICRAPHGATAGYRLEGRRYVPRLAQMDMAGWENSGLDGFYEGLELFAREMAGTVCGLDCKVELDRFGKYLLDYCSLFPDSELAEFFGQTPHDSSNEEAGKVYAPRLSKKDIFNIYMWATPDDRDTYYHGASLQHSRLRMTCREKRFYEFCVRNYDRLPGQMLHQYKRLKKQTAPGRRKDAACKRIVIYAAGKNGTRLYKQIRFTPGMQVVGWTDADSGKYKKSRYPIRPLQEIVGLSYDLFVVSIKGQSQLEPFKSILVEAGVRKEAIIAMDEFYEKYL